MANISEMSSPGGAAPDEAKNGRIEFPYAAFTLLAVLAIWLATTMLLSVPAFLLPSPAAIAANAADHWQLL